MIDPVRELKTRARLFHKSVQSADPQALARLRLLPAWRKKAEAERTADAAGFQRKDALTVIARELGFSGWPHALTVLDGDGEIEDFGKLLCPPSCGVFLNHWFARYEEARVQRTTHGGFLLAYARQFLVVTREFIETLGLDPDDPDWDRIGWDWAQPLDRAARRQLYGKLIAARAAEQPGLYG